MIDPIKKLKTYLRKTEKEISKACDRDSEVNLGGNGINSTEAWLTFKALKEDIESIIGPINL